MINGQILRELFQAIEDKNDPRIFEALLKLIQMEREKKNFALANELTKMLPPDFNKRIRKTRNRTLVSFNIPKDTTRDIPLLEIKNFSLKSSQLVVSERITNVLNQIILEQQKREILDIYYLKPISRLLFFGPPGCGKTLAVKILSSTLHIPVVYVRFDGLISSYLGETSANLKKVFDFVADGDWILFFDEFDAIGKSREDYHENGEMRRLINSFLQQIDNYEGHAIIICATNFYENLDPALWRRFHELVFFGLPDVELREKMFTLFLSNIMKKRLDYEKFAMLTENMSGADIESICVRALKNGALTGREIVNENLYFEIEEQHLRNKFKTQFMYKKETLNSTIK